MWQCAWALTMTFLSRLYCQALLWMWVEVSSLFPQAQASESMKYAPSRMLGILWWYLHKPFQHRPNLRRTKRQNQFTEIVMLKLLNVLTKFCNLSILMVTHAFEVFIVLALVVAVFVVQFGWSVLLDNSWPIGQYIIESDLIDFSGRFIFWCGQSTLQPSTLTDKSGLCYSVQRK